jgi:serine/threonine-protein kinase
MNIGQTIGNYRLVEKLGEGGIGVVFGAQHTQLSRRAAIKVLRPEFSADKDMVSRFFTEAESVNLVQHPGIVSIFEFGRLPDQTAYIVMELLEGDTLKKRMAARLGLPGLRLIRQIASALAAVHAHGIVHRDLKPDNVIIVADPDVPGGERCKILDFGIAKIRAPVVPEGVDLHATRSGQMMGTPIYMSPEQFRDAAAVTDRADVYSLGVMLYEVLAGQPPFVGQGLADLAGMHLYVPPRPLREHDPTLPEALEALVGRMLAKAPGDRPSMTEVAAQLDAIIEAALPASSVTGGARGPTGVIAPVGALPSHLSGPTLPHGAPATQARTAPGPATLGPGRRRALVPALVLTGAALLGAGGVLIWRRQQQPQVVVLPPPAPPPPIAPPAPAPVDLLALREQALRALQEGLREADAGLRRRALAVLEKGRDPRYSALAAPLLRDGDPEVQAQAAHAVQRLGDRGAVPALLALLDDSTVAQEVRVQAAGALLALGEPKGERLLRGALRDRDDRVRLGAARWLAERGERRAQKLLLDAGDLDEDRALVLGRLARRGEREAEEALRRYLAPERPTDELTVRAAEELARGEDVPARALLEQLARTDGPLRVRAARTLALLDEPAVHDQLLAAFSDAAAAVPERALAAEGLGASGRKESALPLAGVLPREAAAAQRLRLAAAGALLQLAALDPDLIGKESLILLSERLKEAAPAARALAVASLGDAEPGSAVPLLGEAIRDAEPAVRQSAARALGRTRVRAAVPVLGTALGDSVEDVRTEALASVAKVGQHLRGKGEPVDDMVKLVAERPAAGGAAERVARAATLVRLGERAPMQELQEALREKDPAVRVNAAAALVEGGDERGVPVLEKTVAGKGAVALHARGHLLRLGKAVPSATPTYDPGRSEDERVALVAHAAHLPEGEALAILRRAAHDLAVAVRLQVVEALGELPALLLKAAGRRVLATLLSDSDPLVRSRAGLLAARLPALKRQAPDKAEDKGQAPGPAPAPAPVDAGTGAPDAAGKQAQAPQKGHLIIEAEEGVSHQLDRRPPQRGPQGAVSLSPGKHKVSYAGGAIEVEVPPGETVTVRVPLSQGEQAVLDAEEAFAAGDLAKAQERLSRARGLLGRSGGSKDRWVGLLLTQARLHEAGGRWLEAMNELEQLDRKVPPGSRSAAQRAAAQEVFGRVSAKLGRVKVSKETDGACRTTEIWALPGVHEIDVGGQTREIRVRAGQITEVEACK